MNRDLNITRILLQKIPEEIIREHILPYTYTPQKKTLLRDIQSFTSEWNTITAYYTAPSVLFYDISYFCKILAKDNNYSYYKEPWVSRNKEIDYFVEYRRMMVICAKRKDMVSYQIYIYKLMYAFIHSMHLYRKSIWFLFGLLKPFQRTNFIKKYVST